MFPVPSHLPRTGGDHLASPPNEVENVEVDSVLSLFEPLLAQGQELDSKTVRGVRERLQDAITGNKAASHELLKTNYPSISSHIRAGSEIIADFASIQQSLTKLESRIDPTNSETSFIPPVIALLRRHFTAVQAQAQATARVQALKQLKERTESLRQLEEGVNEARGAEDSVVDLLVRGDEPMAQALAESQVIKTIKARTDVLRATAIQQLTDGYKQAVSVQEGSDGQGSITVQSAVKLQKPRNVRTNQASAGSIESPSYELDQIYTALTRLRALAEPVQQVHSRLLKDLIGPLLGGACAISEETSGNGSSLRLKSAPGRLPSEILSDLSNAYTFISSEVFPPISLAEDDRKAFLGGIHASTSEIILSQLIVPSIPESRNDLQSWLDTVRSAVEFEGSTKPAESTTDVLRTFLDNQAGPSWANRRRKQVGEEVRRSVVGGWQGWEAVEISRDKEISVVVEIEVEEEAEIVMSEPVADDAWGFDDKPAPTLPRPTPASATMDSAGDEEVGWEFEEPQLDSQPEAGPSSPRESGDGEADDGWAFDDDLSAPTPAPVPIKPTNPAREAKKLGKRVAKAKIPQDEHESGAESMSGTDMSRTSSIQSAQPRAPSPEVKDWAAWEDEPKKEVAKPKAKRKVLKEEKRIIKETFLVSRACDKLLELVEQVLRDAQEISASPPAPSFALAPALLYTTTTELFDLYRSLIRSHFAEQLQSVPTLSMQVYNDSIHLSDRVAKLAETHEVWSSSEVQRKLREFGEGCFERELTRQRDSLVGTLDTIEWNRGVEGFKRGARIPGQIRSDLEDLSRMFHLIWWTVLPKTTYLSIMGYLVNVVITYVTDNILSQQDITEEESNHLNELLRTLHPLEELFVLEAGQPSSVVEHVQSWLKFCYLSELLSANLVDITYLFENGALIDFTPDELISLLKALFADSEKREKAIERIERGL